MSHYDCKICGEYGCFDCKDEVKMNINERLNILKLRKDELSDYACRMVRGDCDKGCIMESTLKDVKKIYNMIDTLDRIINSGRY